MLLEQPGDNYRPCRMRGREVTCERDPFVFAPLRDQNQEKEKKIKKTGE